MWKSRSRRRGPPRTDEDAMSGYNGAIRAPRAHWGKVMREAPCRSRSWTTSGSTQSEACA
eukprot:5865524-Pleurochrysis_carterae.AAC.1